MIPETNNMPQAGKFITFEGVDGAGKSTHIEATCLAIQTQGFKVHRTREPGGTALGEALRAVLLNQTMPTMSELLLMYAARIAHWQAVIEPHLKQGTWVVCDRFEDSSFAYQASENDALWQACETVSQLTLSGVQPDLTLLFDLPVAVSLQRLHERTHKEGESMDVFEARGAAYFERVRLGFLKRAQAAPQRMCVIDANRPEVEIARDIQAKLNAFWGANEQ